MAPARFGPGRIRNFRTAKPRLSASASSGFLIDTLLTDAGDDRFKPELDLLRHQVQEHDLGAIETAAVYDV